VRADRRVQDEPHEAGRLPHRGGRRRARRRLRLGDVEPLAHEHRRAPALRRRRPLRRRVHHRRRARAARRRPGPVPVGARPLRPVAHVVARAPALRLGDRVRHRGLARPDHARRPDHPLRDGLVPRGRAPREPHDDPQRRLRVADHERLDVGRRADRAQLDGREPGHPLLDADAAGHLRAPPRHHRPDQRRHQAAVDAPGDAGVQAARHPGRHAPRLAGGPPRGGRADRLRQDLRGGPRGPLDAAGRRGDLGVQGDRPPAPARREQGRQEGSGGRHRHAALHPVARRRVGLGRGCRVAQGDGELHRRRDDRRRLRHAVAGAEPRR
jgi:hypothetical protein